MLTTLMLPTTLVDALLLRDLNHLRLEDPEKYLDEGFWWPQSWRCVSVMYASCRAKETFWRDCNLSENMFKKKLFKIFCYFFYMELLANIVYSVYIVSHAHIYTPNQVNCVTNLCFILLNFILKKYLNLKSRDLHYYIEL